VTTRIRRDCVYIACFALAYTVSTPLLPGQECSDECGCDNTGKKIKTCCSDSIPPPAYARPLICEARNRWEQRLSLTNSIQLTFEWFDFGQGEECLSHAVLGPDNCPIGGPTVIDSRNVTFHDQTPSDDAEFDSNGRARHFTSAEYMNDGITHIMHEMGHSLGFDFPNPRYANCLCDCEDPEEECLVSPQQCDDYIRDWKCPMEDPPVAFMIGPHIYHPFPGQGNALMGQQPIPGRRLNITWRDVEILATAYADCGYVNLMAEGASGCQQDEGACCDTSVEVCAEETASGDCQGTDKEWFLERACAEIDCSDENGDPHCTATPQWIDRACSYAYTDSGCDDADVCTFDACCAMPEDAHNSALYGDVVSAPPFYGPDGTVDLTDILAVLDAFGGAFRSDYYVHNMDLRGEAGPCEADGEIDLLDILAVLDAFAGTATCCSGGGGGGGGVPPPPSCPDPPPDDPIIILDPTPVYAQPAAPGDPIIAFDVDVHVYGYGRLRGYQVGLELSGAHAPDAVITEIAVDQTKPTYIFAGVPSGDKHQVIDLANLRMAGAIKQGGVTVRSYLMRFRLERAPGAPQSFDITVATTTETQVADPDGCPNEIPIVDDIFWFE